MTVLGVSVMAHVLGALMMVRADVAVEPAQENLPPMPIVVDLLDPPRLPAPTPAPAEGAPPSEVEAPAPPAETPEVAQAPEPEPIPARPVARRPRPVVAAETVPAVSAPAPVRLALIGDAGLAGARRVGTGGGSGSGSGVGSGNEGGGGSCDMAARLQRVVREDGDIAAAIRQARSISNTSGGAILLWDGDWKQSPGQEGKGLAGVRQAIAVEVAFAPRACKEERVRGLVLLTLSDAPGAERLVLGTGQWRWVDLLEL